TRMIVYIQGRNVGKVCRLSACMCCHQKGREGLLLCSRRDMRLLAQVVKMRWTVRLCSIRPSVMDIGCQITTVWTCRQLMNRSPRTNVGNPAGLLAFIMHTIARMRIL